jgi:methionyl aminopeptidase
MNIVIKTPDEIEKMRLACRLAAEVLDYVAPFVKPGVTTAALDKLCHDYMVDVQGCVPATLNYAPPGYTPYPSSICTSVNHQICHGIPGEKPLRNGDIVNIDITPIKNGYHGDTSRMFLIGNVSIQARRLCDITFECLWKGIQEVRPGATLGDIGHAVQRHAEDAGFSVVREFCGHGIGARFHEDPQVVHYGRPGTGTVLRPNMIFTIEPMINAGKRDIRALGNGWTVVTKDHSLSAQWEHTVLVTESGYEVLTISAGMRPAPAWVSEDRGQKTEDRGGGQ